jgi:uncharacterized protein (DUF2384 family)
MPTVSRTAYADTLEMIEEKAALSMEDVAKIVGASPRSVYRWASGQSGPRAAARDRLLEVAVVVRDLGDTLTPDGAQIWMFAPNPFLDYARPVDLLGKGEFRRVLGAIEGLKDGVFT